MKSFKQQTSMKCFDFADRFDLHSRAPEGIKFSSGRKQIRKRVWILHVLGAKLCPNEERKKNIKLQSISVSKPSITENKLATKIDESIEIEIKKTLK